MTAIQLPVVTYERKKWFFDRRLRQIRNVVNVHDFQDLNDFEVAYFEDLIERKGGEKIDLRRYRPRV